MFKNRSAQVTFVKTPKSDTPETPKTRHTLNEAEIAMIKSTVKVTGSYLVCALVTLKFSDAICEAFVNAMPKK